MRRIELTPGFLAALGMIWFFDEAHMMPSFLAALCAHELGHLLALRLLGVRAEKIRLGFLDAIIQTAPLSYRQEILACLAGPAASVMGALIFRRFAPDFAALSLLLGAFNALPLWPLDGGRALRAALSLTGTLARADACCRAISWGVFALGALAAVYAAAAYGAGLLPLFIWGTVFCRTRYATGEERPCIWGSCGVK